MVKASTAAFFTRQTPTLLDKLQLLWLTPFVGEIIEIVNP